MATHDATTSRRALLAGLATLPAAAPALAAGTNPDARLIDLGRQWRQTSDYAESCPDEVLVAACEARYALERAILDTPAATYAGLAVKAAVAQSYGLNEQIGAHASLIADVQRLAGQSNGGMRPGP